MAGHPADHGALVRAGQVPPPAPQAMPAAVPVPVMQPKSVGVAFVLTFFFGVFGLFYSSVAGAITLLAIAIGGGLLGGVIIGLISLATMGIGSVLFLLIPVFGVAIWIASIIWGCVAASNHNERVRAQYAAFQAAYGRPVHPAR